MNDLVGPDTEDSYEMMTPIVASVERSLCDESGSLKVGRNKALDLADGDST